MATPAAARFPLAVKQLLEQGLALRDRYLEQKISLHGLWTATGRLEARLDRLLGGTCGHPANRGLANHLRRERPYWFTFLYCPGLVDATHNLAEGMMRRLVIIRKHWGGNRTEHGARAQAVLTRICFSASAICFSSSTSFLSRSISSQRSFSFSRFSRSISSPRRAGFTGGTWRG